MAEESVKHEVALTQLAKPSLTIDEVDALLTRLYGLRASKIKEFPSYDDRTYYVKTDPDQGIGGKTEFIFKVLNSEFTARHGVVVTQTDILVFLKSFPELRCQSPVPDLDGQFLSFKTIKNDFLNGEPSQNAVSAVRLFSFIQGQRLLDLAPIPPVFFCKVGRHLGELQNALQKYPGDVQSLKQEMDSWCLDNIPQLKDFVWLVTDVNRRKLVEEVITEFERKVMSIQVELRKGIVHHDYSDCNVLVTSSTGKDKLGNANDFEISGIIDFDDMVFAYLVYDIAVAMMYLMFCSDEPLQATAYLLAGFESQAPLPQKERRLLRVLIAGRFIQSLVLGLYSARFNPDNSCISITQANGWNLLEMLWNQPEEHLMKLWGSIREDAHCKTYI